MIYLNNFINQRVLNKIYGTLHFKTSNAYCFQVKMSNIQQERKHILGHLINLKTSLKKGNHSMISFLIMME